MKKDTPQYKEAKATACPWRVPTRSGQAVVYFPGYSAGKHSTAFLAGGQAGIPFVADPQRRNGPFQFFFQTGPSGRPDSRGITASRAGKRLNKYRAGRCRPGKGSFLRSLGVPSQMSRRCMECSCRVFCQCSGTRQSFGRDRYPFWFLHRKGNTGCSEEVWNIL